MSSRMPGYFLGIPLSPVHKTRSPVGSYFQYYVCSNFYISKTWNQSHESFYALVGTQIDSVDHTVTIHTSVSYWRTKKWLCCDKLLCIPAEFTHFTYILDSSWSATVFDNTYTDFNVVVSVKDRTVFRKKNLTCSIINTISKNIKKIILSVTPNITLKSCIKQVILNIRFCHICANI